MQLSYIIPYKKENIYPAIAGLIFSLLNEILWNDWRFLKLVLFRHFYYPHCEDKPLWLVSRFSYIKTGLKEK
jgi:hypothetical protein